MAYNFNPHRHVKIWLSKDKDIFLNLENRIRLVKMRDINPDDEIYFVYDSSLLSQKALVELESFCAKYEIIAKDVQKDVIPYCRSKEESDLIEIYEDEIFHLEEGGNLAVGSDILRWLKPVYELGTYTDFDVHVDTRKLPERISVESPLLLSLGSYAVQSDVESICINNDTIAVVDSQEALSYIQKIQKFIYESCSKQPFHEENFIERLMSTSRDRLSKLFSPFSAEMLLNLDPNSKVLSILANMSRGKTAREVRKRVIDFTANNVFFGESVLIDNGKYEWRLSANEIIKEAATLKRAALKQQLGWLTWLLLPKNQYKQIEEFASIQDDNEFLTRIREQTRMTILKSSVIYTSGPGVLLFALFDKLFYKKDTVNNEIMPFSFACYELEKAFVSQNSIPLHATAQTVATKMQNTEVGKSNDLSWLQEGQNATAIREQKIIEAQAHMPQDFHDMHEKIAAHINKIQADLEGCFGFYRHRERHAKILALQSIIGHFEEHSFDISAFHIALNNYRTKDISASIGKSKTKELIDELELFSQRVKHYMLTDEHGRVEILSPTPTNQSL